jgi:IMP dehydrogenase/GMP reductase
MRKALTFDDVCLVPRYNNIDSRTEPDLSSWLTRKFKVGMPLLAANMDTVIGTDLAEILVQNGGIPIFHRFTDFETQKKWVEEFDGRVVLSCGIDKFANISKLLDLDPLGLCIDVAHGHSQRMVELIGTIKDHYPLVEIIAGNVCTARAYHDLVNAGADAVKVGIGPGAVCTTRTITGFGVPQFTAIRDCCGESNHFRIPIIADGGIRSSKDVALALAAGASTVMVGKLFALTKESAAEKRPSTPAGRVHGGICDEAKYRGQASEDFQNEFYGGLKEKTVAEGTDFWAPVSGHAQALIDDLLGGLRSAMTYGGARSIKEFQRKAEFVEVTTAYDAESKSRRE